MLTEAHHAVERHTEPVVVNLAIEPVEPPEVVAWVDPASK
jgi:hypothetical protein